MKKTLLLIISILLLTCSCGKFDITQAKNEFKDKVSSSKAYELKANMEIYNNEDTFKYAITVNYQKDDYYKVSMINQHNDHEQIILKNEEAVYVVTPSLNKSFKFESEWPDNSSQSYILSSLLNDLLNDTSAELKEEDNKYVIKTAVNYPHNKSLEYQRLYFDKDMNLEKVSVYDGNDNEKIKVTIENIDYKAKYSDDYFDLETLIDSTDLENNEDSESNTNNETSENNSKNESKNSTTDTNQSENNAQSSTQESNTQDNNLQEDSQTSSINDILYPLYIPTNTYLKSTDTITNDSVDRTILTFNGDSSFILVQEDATVSKEFEIIPVSGEPLILSNSIAALSDNSLTWHDNGKEYYLTSSNLSSDELMTIASSLGNSTYIGK